MRESRGTFRARSRGQNGVRTGSDPKRSEIGTELGSEIDPELRYRETMRRGPFVAFLFVALMSAGCSGNSGPRFDKTDVDNINRLIENLKTAFNAKDPAKAAALYSTTGVVMPPNKP